LLVLLVLLFNYF